MNSEIYPKPKRKRKHERNPNTKQNSTGYQGNKKSYNQDKRFKYGNYNRYYGYRNKNNENDQRIELLQKTWFENKTCLDIGCNVGHLTLWIAKHFQPFKIKGVDIDPELVKAAKSNVVHYIDENSVKVKGNSSNSKSRPDKVNRNNVNENKFATLEQLISNTNKDLENTRDANTNGDVKKWTDSKEKGKKIEEAKIKYEDKDCGKNSLNPLDQSTLLDGRIFVCNKDSNKANDQSVGKEHREEGTVCGNDPENPPGPPTLSSNKAVICNGDSNKDETSNKDSSISQQNKFPYNVSFITENYAPASSTVLKYVKEEYDVILCLSVTKWVQLNHGDEVLKNMFKKIYKHLKPGGKFILEPQPFVSYKRRKNITEEIRKNYDNMNFKPEDYISYLTSSEIGFSSFNQLDIIQHSLQVFENGLTSQVL